MSNASFNNSVKNTPLENSKSAPLALSTQSCCRNRYTSSEQITALAVGVYKKKCARGITYQDCLENGFAYHKRQAQDTLKYHLRIGTLFTLEDKRPQQYYPTAIRAEVMENKQKNTPIDPTGVALPNLPHISKGPLANCLELVIMQTLEGYVLPLLPEASLFIHNMHFKTKVSPECYIELNLPYYKKNKGKYHTEIIGSTHVDYVFYSSGTININTTCSKNPYKLETEEDRSRIISFFGQIRDRLIILLCDKHERLVPDIMDWQLTEADINKDIKVSDVFHFSAIKVQVRHLDHLFSVYVKSMGEHTVCRLEERKHPAEKPAIEFVNDTFNPIGRLEKQIAEIEKKVDVMLLKGNDNNNDNHDPQSLNGISLQNGKGGNGNNNSCPDARRRMMKGGEE
jgi:hypothetical protein